MKNKITILLLAALALITTACSQSESGPTVAPPSWKGFDYSVKKEIGDGKYEELKRGPIKPGDEIKLYAVRKSHGKLVGQINGKMHLKYTAYMKEGAPVTQYLDKNVISTANNSLDGWNDPYATFTLPLLNGEYDSYKVEVACELYFRTFGNQYSEVDLSDQTSHEDSYIGNIYTVLTSFSPINGGSANSGQEAGGLKYHTIYSSK